MLRLLCAFVLLLMMSGCASAPLNPAGSFYDNREVSEVAPSEALDAKLARCRSRPLG
jgi:hypothetical protein